MWRSLVSAWWNLGCAETHQSTDSFLADLCLILSQHKLWLKCCCHTDQKMRVYCLGLMTENILLCELCVRLPAWDKPLSVQTYKGFLKREIYLVIRLHCQTDCKPSSVFRNVKQLCERDLTAHSPLLPSSFTWVRLQLSLWQACNMPCTWLSFRIMVLYLPCIHRIMCRRYKSCGRKWVIFPTH